VELNGRAGPEEGSDRQANKGGEREVIVPLGESGEATAAVAVAGPLLLSSAGGFL